MSFILDALRKSEHERQRQSGPGLAEVAVAAPRPKVNVWATAAVVLLVVNLLAVGVLLWRRANAPVAVEAATVAAPQARPAADRAPAASSAQSASITATAPATAQAEVPAAASATGIPPMLQPADTRTPDPGTRNPLELEMAGGAMPLDPVLAERGASVPAGPPAVTEYGSETRPGSVVYETAPGAGSSPDASSGLPTIDDVAAQGGFPEMHLDLHVFSSNAQDRFVFVNKRKYREGETLQEGPLVEQITRDGVVLSQHGRRFILPRQ
jgi:general secretion pathway protein B